MAGSTPIYGFPYPEATDLVADYPALGQELAEDIETVIDGISVGLNAMVPTSTANSGGTVTQQGNKTLFSGVTSVSLNGVFTSSYLFYRVIMSGYASAGTPNLFFRYRASGSDLTGTEYNYDQNYGSGRNSATNATSVLLASLGTGGVDRGNTTMDVMYPQNASNATSAVGVSFRATSPLTFMHGHTYTAITSIDGFTMYVTSGTLTGHVGILGYNA